MPYEMRLVRNRQSPGGQILCDGCNSLISRRKFNNFLRFHQTPKCGKCGSDKLTVNAPYEIRHGQLFWSPRKKFSKKRVQGKRETTR